MRRTIGLQRKIVHSIFRFLFLAAPLLAQDQDSSSHLSVGVESSYFDLMRYDSDNSSSAAFMKKSSAVLSYQTTSDTFFCALHADRQYFRYSNRASAWNALIQQDENRLELGWRGTLSFMNLAGAISFAERTPARPGLFLAAAIRPFGPALLIAGEIVVDVSHSNASTVLEDFFVPFSQHIASTKYSGSVVFNPVRELQIGFSSFAEQSSSIDNADAFSLSYSNPAFGRTFDLCYRIREETSAFCSLGIVLQRPSIGMANNGLSFSNIPSTELTFYHAAFGLTSRFRNIPFSVGYRRDNVTFNGSGVLESWPFTPLAASIIQNRLLFSMTGSLQIHRGSIQTEFPFFGTTLQPTLSYYQVIPEYTLNHWQPLFLVFGTSGQTTETTDIELMQLLSLRMEISIPLGKRTIQLTAEQYLPLSIRYVPASAPSTGEAPVPTTPSQHKTDGGRYLGIRLVF
jgi:hypothetical protein